MELGDQGQGITACIQGVFPTGACEGVVVPPKSSGSFERWELSIR